MHGCDRAPPVQPPPGLDAPSPLRKQYTDTAAGSRGKAGSWDGLRESSGAARGDQDLSHPARTASVNSNHAGRVESRASTRATYRSDLVVGQNSSRIGEGKGAFIDGDRFWDRRGTCSERRRIRWHDHGWRWRHHQDGRGPLSWNAFAKLAKNTRKSSWQPTRMV